jgi:glycosyltransferase involved in cell wall biosynthesis
LKKRRRVAVIYPLGNLDSVPSLTSAVSLFVERGYLVDVFAPADAQFVPPSFSDQRVTVLPFQPAPRHLQPWPWRAVPSRVAWAASVLARHRSARYACLVGVEPEGLIRAAEMARWVKAPIVYYSLELLLSNELQTAAELALKDSERRLSRQAALIVIQDEERAALLVAENGLSPERVVCVPNAPLGGASAAKSDYLRTRLGLSSDTRIMLHAGTLSRWSGAHQLMLATRDWPSHWELACHTQSVADWRAADYRASLEQLAAPGRVVFTSAPLPFDDYPRLVRSADILLAYYCPLDESRFTQANLRHIGLSSGKIAYALQAGVPVVTTPIASLRRLIDSYHCGEIVEDPVHNRGAIERILGSYARYSDGAMACFNAELDYRRHFQRVLDVIDGL